VHLLTLAPTLIQQGAPSQLSTAATTTTGAAVITHTAEGGADDTGVLSASSSSSSAAQRDGEDKPAADGQAPSTAAVGASNAVTPGAFDSAGVRSASAPATTNTSAYNNNSSSFSTARDPEEPRRGSAGVKHSLYGDLEVQGRVTSGSGPTDKPEEQRAAHNDSGRPSTLQQHNSDSAGSSSTSQRPGACQQRARMSAGADTQDGASPTGTI
jgi:hypothetical protein